MHTIPIISISVVSILLEKSDDGFGWPYFTKYVVLVLRVCGRINNTDYTFRF